jgi:LuxR family maltose regulon positive regulatory protein
MISVEANVAILQALHASLSGEVGRSVAAARRALSLHPEGAEPGRSIANIGLGHALYLEGEPGAALLAFAEAVHALSGEDRSLALIAALGGQALTQIDTGDLDRGERSLVRAEQLVEKLALGDDARVALSLLARGKLCELRGDPSGAETAYVRAAVLAGRGGRRLFVAHALLLDAGVKRRRRDHAEARALTREARAIVETCPDPGVLGEMLARTERSLQLTSVPGSAPVLPTDPELSERELVVLRLLASELSQREIGSELYVSFNTVKAHTRSIFRKLGVSSRADAVARSRELGLL